MIHFKSCIRCGGDVTARKDLYGEYIFCLQCGWSKDISGDPLSKLAEIAVDPAKPMMAVRRAS